MNSVHADGWSVVDRGDDFGLTSQFRWRRGKIILSGVHLLRGVVLWRKARKLHDLN